MPNTASRILRSPVTLASGFFATLLFGMAAAVVGHVRPTSLWVQRIIVAWSKAWLIPAGVRLEVDGVENIDHGVSYVITANHLSNMDIMVCFAAIPLPIRYLAKRELFRLPLLAQAMRAIGIVEVDRRHERPGSVVASVIRQAQTVIDRGHSLIIYPEGTRGSDGNPQPFRKGAFSMATSSGMPLLPVTIVGTREIWAPHSLWIHAGRVRVIIDKPIATDGMGREDAESLRLAIETQTVRRYESKRTEFA